MELKDFQKATVEHVIKQLDKNNRFLVADEVGLGKTIVARGVIEELYKRNKKQSKPLHVIYICSNTVLAQQNIQKLNITGSDIQSAYHRLFLMIKDMGIDKNKSRFTISTLTPNTSFRMKKSKGTAEERALLYKILRENYFPPGDKKISIRVKKMLIGDCGENSWNWWTNRYISNVSFREGVVDKIKEEFKNKGIIEDINLFIQELSEEREIDLIVKMRRAVTSVVLDYYIKADLFILDEFQRFNDLIKTDKEESEISEIRETARRIFQSNRKVLLLSATPFKQYSTQWDSENDEDHFKGFDEVLNFLMKEKQSKNLKEITEYRELYISLLNSINWNKKVLIIPLELEKIKSKLVNSYMKGLSRTERSIVEENSLISLTSTHLLLPGREELTASINSIKYLKKYIIKQRFNHQIIEFCKSTPYPFSFLSGYKLYDEINNSSNQNIHEYGRSCISLKNWNSYTQDTGKSHSKIKMLIETTLDSGGHKLLWIPAAITYYKSPNPFNDVDGYSKTLIFSNWAMVPRSISALLSYEQERKIFADSNEKIKYFLPGTKKNERRKPSPKLLFTSSKQHDSSSNSILLYPSTFIAKELSFTINDKLSLENLIVKQKKKVKNFFHVKETNSANIYQFWNWFSMFYLDSNNGFEDEVENWLDDSLILDADDSGEANASHVKKVEKKNLGKKQFIDNIRIRYNKWENETSIIAPDNICEVIAEISLGSPAVCAYRSLEKYFPEKSNKELISNATLIASGFLTLFNKPESIQIIENTIFGSEPYWHKCLKYSAANNIQAVLDEYIYLLNENMDAIEEIAKHIAIMLQLKTSSLDVDFAVTKSIIETKKARCHFAVDYGTQKMSTQSGESRMIHVRDVFNSPFRPFVLTTTSIGQEGLDFHWYCRNIYHWNLPHNPIDVEQREGRINRYKSHVIRLNHAFEFFTSGNIMTNPEKNIWDEIFQYVEYESNKDTEYCDLIPFWHINKKNNKGYNIERFVPLYAFSKDEEKYKTILKVLSLYRMTFGQPNQEQLLHSFMEEKDIIDENTKQFIKNICLDLAPISLKP